MLPDNKLLLIAIGVIIGVIVVPRVRAAVANHAGGSTNSSK